MSNDITKKFYQIFLGDQHLGSTRSFPGRYDYPEESVVWDPIDNELYCMDRIPFWIRKLPKETLMLMLIMGITPDPCRSTAPEYSDLEARVQLEQST